MPEGRWYIIVVTRNSCIDHNLRFADDSGDDFHPNDLSSSISTTFVAFVGVCSKNDVHKQ